MSLLIDRCPFYSQATEINSPSGLVPVRSYQIVLWVGLSIRGKLSREIPAILDTGHSHNFSIKEELLQSWTGMRSRELQTVGWARVNKQLVELKEADVAIFPNAPGRRDLSRGAAPYVLSLPEGIAVHRADDPISPRLPLLGMRALVTNRLRLVIDAHRMEVSIERE
jgi:hypothetical protein